MQRFDGSERPSKHPTVALVFFEERDHELKDALLGSLEQFFDHLKGELPAQPRFSLWNAQNPGAIPAHNQDRAFFPVIEEINAKIVIGVTETGFYDPSLSRCVFSLRELEWQGAAFSLPLPNRESRSPSLPGSSEQTDYQDPCYGMWSQLVLQAGMYSLISPLG